MRSSAPSPRPRYLRTALLLAPLLGVCLLGGCDRMKTVARSVGIPVAQEASEPVVRGMQPYLESGPQLMGEGSTVRVNTSGATYGNTSGERVDTSGTASLNTSPRNKL